MNKQQNEIVAVTWLDAAGKIKEDLDKVKDIAPENLLVVTTTYGILHKQTNQAILIFQEISDTECDYTVIPKSLVVDIKRLKCM